MSTVMGRRGVGWIRGGGGDEAEWDGEGAAAIDEWAPTVGGEWSTPTRDGRETAWTVNG